MTLQLELPGLDEKLLPGRFLLANVYAVDHMFDGEIGPYWPAIIVDRSIAPSKVERRQEAAIITSRPIPSEEEYLIWLVGRNRL